MYVKLSSKLLLIRYYTDIASWFMNCVSTFQNKKCLQNCPFTELRWVDISNNLQCKVYQSEVYRLVWFSGLFASYTRKVYRIILYRLVRFFFCHLLTYLRPLYQLKGVSATAEKRVNLFIQREAACTFFNCSHDSFSWLSIERDFLVVSLAIIWKLL